MPGRKGARYRVATFPPDVFAASCAEQVLPGLVRSRYSHCMVISFFFFTTSTILIVLFGCIERHRRL
jgi:hypothetical protein